MRAIRPSALFKRASANLGEIMARHAFALSSVPFILLGAMVAAPSVHACDSPPKNGDAVITKGVILTPTINVAVAPGQPEIALTYKVGPSGLSEIYYVFQSESTAQQFGATAYFPDAPGSGTVDLLSFYAGASPYVNQGGFTLYSAPGKWDVIQINIYDYAGHCTYYEGVTSIMPQNSVTVVNNGTPDTTPPTISAAKILTPTIKRSATYPFLKLDMTVADDLSGVELVSAVFTNAAKDSSFDIYSGSVAPVRSGIIEAGLRLNASYPTGTYVVTSVVACDAADNCYTLGKGTKLSELFGGKTSFTVTE
jgi:hypothetical protein